MLHNSMGWRAPGNSGSGSDPIRVAETRPPLQNTYIHKLFSTRVFDFIVTSTVSAVTPTARILVHRSSRYI